MRQHWLFLLGVVFLFGFTLGHIENRNKINTYQGTSSPLRWYDEQTGRLQNWQIIRGGKKKSFLSDIKLSVASIISRVTGWFSGKKKTYNPSPKGNKAKRSSDKKISSKPTVSSIPANNRLMKVDLHPLLLRFYYFCCNGRKLNPFKIILQRIAS